MFRYCYFPRFYRVFKLSKVFLKFLLQSIFAPPYITHYTPYICARQEEHGNKKEASLGFSIIGNY